MLKTKNVFTYLYIMIILVLIAIPILWTKYGNVLVNKFYYHEYVYTDDVNIITNKDKNLELEYTADSNGEMYVHIIYEDYEKNILEFDIKAGNNKLTIAKRDKELINIYIFYIDKHKEYKWIILEM